MKTLITTAAIAALLPVASSFAADVSQSTNGGTVTYTFDGFTGEGFTSGGGGGLLNSDDIIVRGVSGSTSSSGGSGTVGGGSGTTPTSGDFDFGETRDEGGFARESGGTGNGTMGGGVYSFNVGGDTLLGIQPDADNFTPGSFIFRFRNSDAADIVSVSLDSDLYVNNRSNSSTTLDVYVTTDGSTFAREGDLATYSSPVPADLMGSGLTQTTDLTGSTSLSVGNGGFFYVVVAVNGAEGMTNDELALGDFSISAEFDAAPVPEPLAAGAAGLLGLVALRRRR